MIELRSSSELKEQANGSTPKTEHRDNTEITEIATRSLEALSSVITQTGEKIWASPETNFLIRQFPQILQGPNPVTSEATLLEVKVFTGVNQSVQNQITSFRIPLFALKKLSSDFEHCFTHSMLEANRNILEWHDLHIQAAAQIILFAHLKAKIIELDQYRSLEALKQQFPDEFPDILYDIFKFCEVYQISILKKECEQFIKNQIEKDLHETATFLQWACNVPSDLKVIELWETVVLDQASTLQKRIEIFEIFISIAESDYSECSAEHKSFIMRSLQQSFEKIVFKFSGDSVVERERLYQCLLKLYPRFNISNTLKTKVLQLSPTTLLQSTESNETKAVFAFLLASSGEALSFVTIQQFLESSTTESWPTEIVFLIRAILFFGKEDYIQAIQNFSHVININSKNIYALDRRGDCFRLKGELDSACRDLNRSLELDPKNAFALASRGECFRLKGDLDSALKDFNHSLELDPNNAFALACRGECFRLKGDLDSALKDLNCSLELDRNNAFALACRGECYYKKHRWTNAIEDYNRFLVLEPDNAQILLHRGECFYHQRDYIAALVNVNRSLELDPDCLLALLNRGECFRIKGELDSSYKDFNRVLELDPNNAHALILRGEYFQMKKDFDSALKDYNRSLEIERNHYILANIEVCIRAKEIYLKEANAFTLKKIWIAFSKISTAILNWIKYIFGFAIRSK